jgi:hypothetical protein
MPGLIRGVARTAVVAGTATAVSNRVSRRQANRWAQQAEQPAFTEPVTGNGSATAVDPIERLQELGKLHEQGILTDEEFARQMAKLLE